jgi:hypothetical protein
VARDLGLDEVVDHFTLVGDELDLLRNKSGATRLGFAALLKFLLWRGRFPRAAHELPGDAVAHLARQVRVPAMPAEISKLEAIRAIGLPADLFAGIAPSVVAGWRARAIVESPIHLRQHPQPTKLALLCALLALREREVTDSLAQLLISTVHRINAHAEQKVIAELVKDYKRVTGKETLLRKIAEASLGTPDDTVRQVIYPVVGGETTLKDLVAEYGAKGTEYQRQKRKVFKASYTNHYRRGHRHQRHRCRRPRPQRG